MEGSKEEGVLVGSVSEHTVVAGDESETLAVSMVTEVQGQCQIEEPSAEDMLEEGELCDKGNVNVCSGSNSICEAENSCCDVSGLQGVGDSGGLPEEQNQVDGVTVEERLEINNITTGDEGVASDDKGSLQLESINDEAGNDGVGTLFDGSAEAVSSTEERSQNLPTVEVVMRRVEANENVNARVVKGDLQDKGDKEKKQTPLKKLPMLKVRKSQMKYCLGRM